MVSTGEKKIIVYLPDTTAAETVEEQLREEIIERIRGSVGVVSVNRQVVAARKLKSGDLAVSVDSPAANEMESTVDWANSIALGVVVKKCTWRVLIHGVRVADYP